MTDHNTPRLRADLRATAVEEAGIKYFDVSDPRSGGKLRLYDFEWLIAERMDGSRPFADVASWATDRLGLHSSASDLSEYAKKLDDLGFFEAEAEAAHPVWVPLHERVEDPNDPDLTPLPKPSPAEAMHASNGFEIDTNVSDTIASAAPRHTPAEDVEVSADDDMVVDSAPAQPAAPQTFYTSPMADSTGPVPIMPVRPAPKPKSSGGAGSILALLIVLAAIAGVVVYLQYFRQQPAKVAVALASPREVVRFYDGAGTVKKGEAQALSFGESGKVVDVVAKGTEAKAGMPLASLEAYGPIEKQLVDVKDRLAFYEKQLAAAKEKGSDSGTKSAQGKVDEKSKLMQQLEARAAKVRLVAPTSGQVAEVLVTAGGEAKAGEAAVKIGDGRMTVEFKLADGPKLGEAVTLRAATGGSTLAGKVTSTPEGMVVVELPEDAGTLKAGDSLQLVKQKQSNLIPLPAAALQKRDNADVVFVLSDGAARLRKVTVVDRTPTEVYIGSGLATGDSVITSGAEALQDGQKASTN